MMPMELLRPGLRLRRLYWASAAILVAGTMLASASAGPVAGTSAPGVRSGVSPGLKALYWQRINPPTAPTPRNWFGMAYDYADHYTVLYGGYDPSLGRFYNDTWTYVAGNWTLLHPTYRPTAKSGLKLVYDPALKGVVAFGGEAPFGGAYYNDTWLFQKGNWTQLFPTVSPSPRSQYAMTYDPADSEIVLFSGSAGGTDFSDTWTFNGTTWARAISTVHPAGREFANMVFDARSGKAMLAGGANYSTGPTNDTWTFSHGAWTLLPHANFPGRVHTPLAALANGTPFLFGGQTSYGSTIYNTSFEYFGGRWQLVPVAGAPTPRTNGGLVFDTADHHLLMFGGGIFPTLWNQTYLLR